MGSGDLSQKDTLITSQGVKPNSAVVGHHNEFTVVVGKNELLDLKLNLDLMGQDESLRVVDVNTISIVSHNSKAAHRLSSKLGEISSTDI